ncbi:MAG: hypothetical protein VKJ66_01555 [Synechococcus sp.]|nr:hypothetical protein [Synechococcus sp.]
MSMEPEDNDDWAEPRGLPLGLRALALVGAFSFVMLGLSVLAPLLYPPQNPPQRPPGQGERVAGGSTTSREPRTMFMPQWKG